MKAQLFSNQERRKVLNEAASFIEQIGGRNVQRVECGRDGIIYRMAIYYTEA